jgi:asparagine synthase (glutamine-hydrolysing)
MCGLAGFWERGGGGDLERIGTAMADRIRHRGPDGSGVWSQADAGLVLSHRRLSILDLSAAGSQPMVSAGGRFVIAYNGEVYNHLALRERLAGEAAAPRWRGHSDTETILACIEAWGVDATLRACVGMFALALWDRSERSLWLARDRIGEKPLYYGWQGTAFLFGSELKALRAHPAFNAAIDRDALALLLRHNYVPAPHSIHQGIRKLMPGTWLRLRAHERDVDPVAYWSLAEVATAGIADPFRGSDDDALARLETLLGSAVSGQMVADVPLGSLLSGGIDSTAVTALMQAHSSKPVRTFTIGFEEGAYDEARHARAVAAHLGTEHTELRLGAADALALIPRLPEVYDEPFADSSQLPTFLVMKLARQHVTVALSGDGGDEVFGGYNRYFLAPRVWERMRRVPQPLRVLAGRALTAFPARPVNAFGASISGITGVSQLGDKFHRIGARLAGVHSLDELYVSLCSEWRDGSPVLGAGNPVSFLSHSSQWPAIDDPAQRMMALDALTFLPDDILVKVDRASMASSLETRAPFLDADLMRFAWSLPVGMKLRGGQGKWLVRRLIDRYLPRALVDRPKMGFSIPLDDWLRGPLRDWAESLLGAERLRQEGFLDPAPVRAAWQSHLQGRAAVGYRLWSVLMFQAWLEHQGVDAA